MQTTKVREVRRDAIGIKHLSNDPIIVARITSSIKFRKNEYNEVQVTKPEPHRLEVKLKFWRYLLLGTPQVIL